jgi:hypothetical protein
VRISIAHLSKANVSVKCGAEHMNLSGALYGVDRASVWRNWSWCIRRMITVIAAALL